MIPATFRSVVCVAALLSSGLPNAFGPALAEVQPPNVGQRGPGALPPDPYNAHRINPGEAFDAFLAGASNMVGDVEAEPMTFAQALAVLRRALVWPEARAAVAASRGPHGSTATQARAAAFVLTLKGQGGAALVFLLRAHEVDPNDADALRNLAGLAMHLGLVNEGLAIVLEAERRGAGGRKSAMVDPAAQDAYLIGFAEMRRKNLAAAKAQLQRALTIQPGFPEARRALALVLKALGEDDEAKKQFMLGVWRRMPPRLNVKGAGTGPIREIDTSRDELPADGVSMIPLRDVIDLSRGKDGKLPAYRYPSTPEEVDGLWSAAWNRALYPRQAKAEQEAVAARWQAVAAPREGEIIARQSESASAAWRLGLFLRLINIDEDEPAIQRAAKPFCDLVYWGYSTAVCGIAPQQRADGTSPLDRAASRIQEERRKREDALSRRYHPNPVPCRENRQFSIQAIHEFRPTFNEVHSVYIRYYNIWYRHASAIAASIADPYWREAYALEVRHRAALQRANFVGHLSRAFATVVGMSHHACPDGIERPALESAEDGIDVCQQATGGATYELPVDLKVASLKFSVACDKFGIEVSGDIFSIPENPFVKAGIGPFVGIEFRNKGEIVVGAGLGAEAGIGADKIAGASVGAKAGVYVTVDAKTGAISQVDPRFGVEGTVKTSAGNVTYDLASGSLVPAPPSSRAALKPWNR